jgi:hypothetical protein
MTSIQEDARRGLQAVADFMTWMADYLQPLEYVFRGQADHDWLLVPSAGRPGGKGIQSQTDLNKWKQVVGPVLQVKPTPELEWLVLAQHYGVHTPLLDWTYNPLAALFFASEPAQNPGRVYALPTAPFEEYDSLLFVDPFAADQCPLVIVRADAMNTRATAQRSVMTLHRPRTLDAWAFKVDQDEHLGLSIEPFHLATETKPYVRAALAILGISKLTLMADINSAVEVFNEGTT